MSATLLGGFEALLLGRSGDTVAVVLMGDSITSFSGDEVLFSGVVTIFSGDVAPFRAVVETSVSTDTAVASFSEDGATSGGDVL